MKIKKNLDEWRDKSKESQAKSKGYWKGFMQSAQQKLSHGASMIVKLIPFARKDNWRRKDKR